LSTASCSSKKHGTHTRASNLQASDPPTQRKRLGTRRLREAAHLQTAAAIERRRKRRGEQEREEEQEEEEKQVTAAGVQITDVERNEPQPPPPPPPPPPPSLPPLLIDQELHQRVLVYARVDPRADWSEAQHRAHVARELRMVEAAFDLSPSQCVHASETGAADDLTRDMLQAVIVEQVLQCRLDRIVMMHRDRLVPDAAYPLLEWLCAQHGVVVECVQPAFRGTSAAAAATTATSSRAVDASLFP
jgi:hypothetical protein